MAEFGWWSSVGVLDLEFWVRVAVMARGLRACHRARGNRRRRMLLELGGDEDGR